MFRPLPPTLPTTRRGARNGDGAMPAPLTRMAVFGEAAVIAQLTESARLTALALAITVLAALATFGAGLTLTA